MYHTVENFDFSLPDMPDFDAPDLSEIQETISSGLENVDIPSFNDSENNNSENENNSIPDLSEIQEALSSTDLSSGLPDFEIDMPDISGEISKIIDEQFKKFSKPCDVIDCDSAYQNISDTIGPKIKAEISNQMADPCKNIDCDAAYESISKSIGPKVKAEMKSEIKEQFSKPCDVIDCDTAFQNIADNVGPKIIGKVTILTIIFSILFGIILICLFILLLRKRS